MSNSKQVTLPDGTCLKIDNASAEQAACIVAERLGLMSGVSQPCTANTPGAIEVTAYHFAESALVMPVMNFNLKQAAEQEEEEEEAAMVMPRSRF